MKDEQQQALNPLDINVEYDKYIASPTSENYENIFHASKRLLDKFVNSFNKPQLEQDLYQSGYIGLIRAIKSYNPDSGTKFSTWASTCIISEMRHEVRREHKFFNIKSGDDAQNSDSPSGLISLTTDNADDESFEYDVKDSKAELDTGDNLELKLIIEQFSDLDRQIIDLLFFKDMSQEKAAQILNTTQKVISRRKAKILHVLKEEMSASFKLIDNSYSFKFVKNLHKIK